MAQSVYRYIGRTKDALFIVDKCLPTSRSLTNSAHYVCRECTTVFGNLRVIYRDSAGRWDEMVHEGGYFRFFRPLNETERAAWAEFLISIDEPYPPLET